MAGTQVSTGTWFQWMPTTGASTYRVEFYLATAEDTDRPIAGMEVPSNRAKVLLTAVTKAHLHTDQVYSWRVRAIGGDGQVIAESPRRKVFIVSP